MFCKSSADELARRDSALRDELNRALQTEREYVAHLVDTAIKGAAVTSGVPPDLQAQIVRDAQAASVRVLESAGVQHDQTWTLAVAVARQSAIAAMAAWRQIRRTPE